MCECVDGSAFVDSLDNPLELDEIEDVARKITTFDNATYLAQIDYSYHTPAELKDLRNTQRVFCARYGHQPLSMWGDRPVTDLIHFSKGLQQLISKESATTRMNEDG